MSSRLLRGEILTLHDGTSHTVEAEWIEYDAEEQTILDPTGILWRWESRDVLNRKHLAVIHVAPKREP